MDELCFSHVPAFQFSGADGWVAVPGPAFGFPAAFNSLDRTEVDAGTTDLATVLPYRLSVLEFDIFSRADPGTGPAGSTGRGHRKLPRPGPCT